MHHFNVRPLGIRECKIACAEKYPDLYLDGGFNKPSMLKKFLLENTARFSPKNKDNDFYFLSPEERHAEFANWVDRCAPTKLKPGTDWVYLSPTLRYFGIHWEDQQTIDRAIGMLPSKHFAFATSTCNVQLLLMDPWSLKDPLSGEMCFYVNNAKAALAVASEKAEAMSTIVKQHNPCIVVFHDLESNMFNNEGCIIAPNNVFKKITCAYFQNEKEVRKIVDTLYCQLISVIEIHLRK